MTKSNTLLLVAAMVSLSVVNGQVTSPVSVTTTPTTTTTTTTTIAPTSAITGAPAPVVPTFPSGNFTSAPNWSSLANVIAGFATSRGVNGNAQSTNTANSAVGSSKMLSTDSRAVMAGLGLVMVTTVLAAMGTLSL
ncbi:hypothetical protein BGX28_000111 [Mortierella sp. GBA30]|nr:hypothetical protein BGX28_000111 [Mortierella sp. GBA30]